MTASELQSTNTYLFNKIEYARWIGNKQLHPFEVGDFVIYRSATFPFKEEDVYKVSAIQEIHYLCIDNKPGLKPRPIELIDRSGNRKWAASVDLNRCLAKGLHF